MDDDLDDAPAVLWIDTKYWIVSDKGDATAMQYVRADHREALEAALASLTTKRQ